MILWVFRGPFDIYILVTGIKFPIIASTFEGVGLYPSFAKSAEIGLVNIGYSKRDPTKPT